MCHDGWANENEAEKSEKYANGRPITPGRASRQTNPPGDIWIAAHKLLQCNSWQSQPLMGGLNQAWGGLKTRSRTGTGSLKLFISFQNNEFMYGPNPKNGGPT